MSSIELTDAQRHILEREPGTPVDVVDPATGQHYVLLTREKYEQLGPVFDSSEDAAAPSPTEMPTVSEVQPSRQRVRDLALPPELAAEARRYCKQLGWWGGQGRRQIEERLKLQYYYGGRWVAYLGGLADPVIVAVADSLSDPRFDEQLALLTAEERSQVRVSSPPALVKIASEVFAAPSDRS